MSRTNYIFIDFENVQETDLDRIADKPVEVTAELDALLPAILAKAFIRLHPISARRVSIHFVTARRAGEP
jgi:hypothetical protein